MKWLLFTFLPVIGVAQTLPHWESSTYVYNKENLGYDCFNVPRSLFEKKNGSIVCQPYQKPLLEIGNIKACKQSQLKKISSHQLIGFFQKENLNLYCSSQGFIAFKKGKTVYDFSRFCKPMESITSYQFLNNILYFIKSRVSENSRTSSTYSLYAFDRHGFRVVKKNMDGMLFKRKRNKLYLIYKINDQLVVTIIKRFSVKTQHSIPFRGTIDAFLSFKSPEQFRIWDHNGFIHSINGKTLSSKQYQQSTTKGVQDKYIFENLPLYRIIRHSNRTLIGQTSNGSNVSVILFSHGSNSYYVGTETELLRIFPHIHSYPRNYYNNNSNSTFSLTQDFTGNIWSGSYQGALCVTNGEKILFTKNLPCKWLAQGVTVGKNMLLPTETEKGIFLFNTGGSFKKIVDSVSAFSFYKSRDNRLYIGTAFKGLWHITINDLTNPRNNWKKLTKKNGLTQNNIIAIGEDRFGNIWTGNSGSIAVYQPKTGYCKTWFKNDKANSHLGARSILITADKNLWFGSVNGGLYYYSGKNANDLDYKNLYAIHHPLLHYGNPITFLHQWGDHILIGAQDKVLLFDLKAWKERGEILIRYLNPMELNLLGSTEQNTCFTDFRDNTFWFTSSENIYRIDLKKWFQIPKFKVEPTITVSLDSSNQHNQSTSSTLQLKAGQNSFKIRIRYQSKDNMPRYLNSVLTKANELPKFSVPNLQHEFNFTNLESGSYAFHVRICQQDGSYSIHRFSIVIESYLWQLWWFWALLSLIPIALIGYIFWKRVQLKDQEKQMAQLSLATLSNQFRPHYMLNALNGISAQLEGKPKAEALISHLGESIDLLFQSARSNHFTHSFANEWELVQHMIEIQRLLYLPDLKLAVTGIELVPIDMQVPTGLIQIPVENALLHGLRHKLSGEKQLTILIEEKQNYFKITIIDNGVGRDQAARINNFKQHGSGLSNIQRMIEIINQFGSHTLAFDVFDLKDGTEIVIRLGK